jgi:DNA-directed RNA polymerase subunit E'/Rpb7
MVIKMSIQAKPAQNTAIILSLSKMPYGKNEWWKNYCNHFPV